MKNFNLNTRLYFGENALDVLGEIQNKKVLVVCDEFMEKFGVAQKVVDKLPSCECFIYSKVLPDPPIEIVADGMEFLKSCQGEIIVAVGGGSVIDAAKAIKELAGRMNIVQVEDFYAIPTTSGTGSEVTKFSVITNVKEGIKYPLVDESLEPTVAILAPELVATVPPHITAETGMDALTHAIEAYVATEANDFTDAMAEKAITLLFRFLPLAYKDGNDLLAREKVHNASCLAGIAFNGAGLGICHSIAHSMGGKFHTSHGKSNAIILPHIIKFNGDTSSCNGTFAAKKYQRLAKILNLPHYNPTVGTNSLVVAVEQLKKSFGIPESFKEAGVAPEDVRSIKDEIVAAALNDACTKTNPKSVDAKDVECILAKIAKFA